ncbi:MAG: decarboxylase, partial [Megasphaera elsdenii]|nr:decarboxylase [Megasphaera elsdenii]MDY5386788.1 decarboxylase [Megasphaera elsdenii]
LELARSVRDAIRAIPGLTVFGREIIDGKVVSGFDETKITIDFSGIGLDGVTAERALRQQGIEVELVAGNHVLALITLGDTEETAQALVEACRTISAGRNLCQAVTVREQALPAPQVVMAPRQAWNCPVEAVPFTEARGRIAAENVTFYPPGIPVLTLGEEITAACQDYIRQKMAHGYKPNGPADGTLATIRVLKEEFHER